MNRKKSSRKKNSSKIPQRTESGCIPFLVGFVCKSTKSGVLSARQRRLVGTGKVLIDANLARCIPLMFAVLPNKGFPASAQEVSLAVSCQLCGWCSGMGWEVCNMGEDVAACFHCKGSGLEPAKKKIKKS